MKTLRTGMCMAGCLALVVGMAGGAQAAKNVVGTYTVEPLQQEQPFEIISTVVDKNKDSQGIAVLIPAARSEALQGALDATKGFSADQVETLAGIAEKLLDTAKGSGMSAETLRRLLTDLQTTPRNQWLGLLPKYRPSPALTAAVLEAVRQIESIDLGVTLSTQEALTLADVLLKALEQGWTPQWIASIKVMRENFEGVQIGDAVQVAVRQLKDTEAFLSSLTLKFGTDGAARPPANLNIQKKGDDLRPANISGGLQPGPNPGGPVLATIRGGLASTSGMGTGNYGFTVNLSSGATSDGFMQGSFGSSFTYDVSGGNGTASGNNFALSGFNGVMLDNGVNPTPVTGSLNGNAAQGFSSVGDIGASGTYAIEDINGPFDQGTITSGQRIQ